jgi:hypothetical protein
MGGREPGLGRRLPRRGGADGGQRRGGARELPDDVVVKAPPDTRPELLGEIVLELLEDAPRRALISAAAQMLTRERSFDHAARFLYENAVYRPRCRSVAVPTPHPEMSGAL